MLRLPGLQTPTYIGNTRADIKACLRHANAKVVLGPEHRRTEEMVAEARLFAKRSGVPSYWAHAQQTNKFLFSSGAVVFV